MNRGPDKQPRRRRSLAEVVEGIHERRERLRAEFGTFPATTRAGLHDDLVDGSDCPRFGCRGTLEQGVCSKCGRIE